MSTVEQHRQLGAITAALGQMVWLLWPAVISLLVGAALLLAGSAGPGRICLIGSWLAGIYALYGQWRLHLDQRLLPWLAEDRQALDQALQQLYGPQPHPPGTRPLADRLRGIRRLIRRQWWALAAQQFGLVLGMFWV